MLKLTKTNIITGLVLLLPLLIVYLLNLNNLTPLLSFLKENQVFIIPLTLIIKIAGMIYPPINGSVLTIAMIPVLGWKLAYLLDFLGSTVGIYITYILGNKYGDRIIIKLAGQNTLDKIKKIRLKNQNQIETAIILRLAPLGLSDVIAWGASTIGFRIKAFIVGSVIAHVVGNLPFFFLISQSINIKSWLFFTPLFGIAVFFIWKNKAKYFDSCDY